MRIAVLLLALIVIGCKNNKSTATEKNEQMVINGWVLVPSPDKTYLLKYEDKQPSVSQPFLEIRYQVEDRDGKKVHAGLIYGGYIKWYDDSRIEYFNTPGVMPEGKEREDFVMIRDLKTGKEIRKSEM